MLSRCQQSITCSSPPGDPIKPRSHSDVLSDLLVRSFRDQRSRPNYKRTPVVPNPSTSAWPGRQKKVNIASLHATINFVRVTFLPVRSYFPHQPRPSPSRLIYG
jgi:hypothetical protein